MIVELEVPAIKNYKGVICKASDSNWAFDSLINELNHIDEELKSTSPYPSKLQLGSFSSRTPPFPPLSPSLTKKSEHSQDLSNEDGRSDVGGPFVMRIPFEDGDDSDEESEEEETESTGLQLVTTGTRFSCTDLDFSEYEASDDESDFETICDSLMRKTSLEEGLLYELERENHLKLKESVRIRVSMLEDEMRDQYEKTAETLSQIEKHAKLKFEIDQQFDKQYQQKIADELDYHLSVVQRNHERRSQEEEFRIRNDAAMEDAKRREKALHEEKIRQENEKAEVEARLEAARKAEEAQKAAFDAAAQASKEAAEKQSRTSIPFANENKTLIEQDEASVGVTEKHRIPQDVDSERQKNVGSAGLKVKAADSAIKAEASRLQKYNEVTGHISQLSTNFIKEYDSYERQINKRIRQISGTVESVRAKTNDIVNIINDPRCHPSISIVLFAKKVVSLCDNPSGTFDGMAFACGHVILLVNSQVPSLMDFILAEFHKVCIYTVPKYIQAVESAARTNDYWKMMGYREENGKLETSEKYLQRIEACMKLYAALVQTETQGVQNPLGLKEGWAWMARFLNEIPATASSATALHAFLKMAGFSLLRKYKVQFKKLLNVISSSFLPVLKAPKNPNLAPIISKLEIYISKQEFLKEPEGWRLRTDLSSRKFV